MSNLTWKTEKRKLSDLKLLENNPRTITETAYERLGKDLDEVGNLDPLLIDTDGVIIGGNQRYRQLKEKGVDEVRVSYPNRELTKKERKRAILLHNRHRGEDDIEMLANEFEDELKELDFWAGQDFDVDPEGKQPEFGSSEDLDTDKKCPKCGYQW